MSEQEFQFYPTSEQLSKRAWAKFKDRSFSRVIDPSAGNGDLLAGAPQGNWSRHAVAVDCIEIDASKHPLLREKGHAVVGMDFMAFEGGEIYSHVIMNPPFAHGARHVLKAWDMLWEGEVVAIINAQTLKNPFSQERCRLAELIDQHGSVEWIEDAFKGDDVVREADVEVALVHLVKPAECAKDWIGPIIDNMRVDHNKEQGFELPFELALPNSFVENQCAGFRQAVRAMREAVKMNAVAGHYASRVGTTMARYGQGEEDVRQQDIRAQMTSRYEDLKDRAWTSVLRSTDTLAKLSAKVQRQAEAQFADIKKLEFTESNVYGFLLGLVQSQPEMQIEMACDVFDQITRYHTDNTVFYRGWVSNNQHRTCGMRIKVTRFIIPGHKANYSDIQWDSYRQLADFDKVFAMLDGKAKPDFGLVDAFKKHFKDLSAGDRISTSYFDIRYYPGVGTIHFFARSKETVDRLNRLVGRHRQWLPPETRTQVPKTFWVQYEKAEKLDAEVRKAATQVWDEERGPGRYYSRWDHPANSFMSGDRERSAQGHALMGQAIDRVLEKHGLLDGIEWDGSPDSGTVPQLLLAA